MTIKHGYASYTNRLLQHEQVLHPTVQQLTVADLII